MDRPETWQYTIEIAWCNDNDGYIATVPMMPGCSAFGADRVTAVKELDDAMAAWLQAKAAADKTK